MANGEFGKYRLIAELGHGGMADVFLAASQGPVGTGFSKLLVIKRLRPDLVEDAEFVDMLLDEARLAARLNHPNVVQTIEVGVVDKQYFIAMEYLDGQPLHRILSRALKRHGGMPKRLQYLVLSDALAGLHHAHELRDYSGEGLDVAHRDVTPHNIFVTYEGQVKVVDFGIAKAAGRRTSTSTGVVKGKVRYMAPEQALNEDVDRRVDIFSTGIMLFEAATGRRMWGKAKEDLRLLHQIVTGEYDSSPQSIDEDVPDAIDAMCRKAMAYEKEDRYATAAAFQDDLDEMIDAIFASDSSGVPSSRRGGRPTNRELGEFVSELFADARDELQELIDRQMSVLASESQPELVSAAAIVTDPTPSLSMSDQPTRVSSRPADSEMETTDSTHGNLAASRRAMTGTSRANTIIAGAALVLAIVVVLLLLPKMEGDESLGVAVDAPSTAATTTRSAATTAQLQKVQLTVRATPADAVIFLDGEELSGNPFEATFAQGDRAYTLRVSAEGHQTDERVVVMNKDTVVDVKLDKATSKSRARARRAKPRPQPTASPPVAAPPASAGVRPKPLRPIDEKAPW